MQIYAARTPSLARLLTEGTAAGSFDLSCMPSLAQADVCPIIPTNGAAPLRCWQALLARGFQIHGHLRIGRERAGDLGHRSHLGRRPPGRGEVAAAH